MENNDIEVPLVNECLMSGVVGVSEGVDVVGVYLSGPGALRTSEKRIC